jgi:hypothetical protein
VQGYRPYINIAARTSESPWTLTLILQTARNIFFKKDGRCGKFHENPSLGLKRITRHIYMVMKP